MNHKYELQSFEKISKLHSVLEDETCYGKKEKKNIARSGKSGIS